MVWLALVAIAAGVLGFIPADDITLRTSKAMLVEWTLLFGVGSLIRSRWLQWFYWWCVLGHILHYNQVSYMAMMTLTVYIIVWELIAREQLNVGRLITGMRIITLVQLAWMGLQFFHIDPLFHAKIRYGVEHMPVAGFLDNTIIAGAFLAIMSPFFYTRWWMLALPAIVAMIAATNSAGAFLVFALISCAYAIVRFRSKTVLIVVCLIASVMSYSTLKENLPKKMVLERSNRLTVWKRTIELAHFTKATALTGWGIGQYRVAFGGVAKRYFKDLSSATGGPGRAWKQAHNEYLQILFDHGWIGLALFLGFVISTLRPHLSIGAEPVILQLCLALFGLLLVAGYSFPFRLAALGIVGTVLSGALESRRRWAS